MCIRFLLLLLTLATPNPCTTPVPSPETRGAAAGWGAGRTWMDQHEDIMTMTGEYDLVLLGDSITQSFGGDRRRVGETGRDARRAHLGGLRLANMGISGDRTQHVLWRIEQGELDDVRATTIVVLIGTNNLSAGDEPEHVEAGIEAIVHQLLERTDASIVLMSILPRGRTAADPMRRAAAEVNTLIRPLARSERVTMLDLGPRLLDDEGRPRQDLVAPDDLHLRPGGYDLWARELAQIVTRGENDDPDRTGGAGRDTPDDGTPASAGTRRDAQRDAGRRRPPE